MACMPPLFMTSWERVKAALRGEEVDRVPVALWRHFPVEDLQADTLAVAHLKWQASYNFDLLKLTPRSGYAAEAWGWRATAWYDEYGVARPLDVGVRHAEEWRRLPVVSPQHRPLAEQVEAVNLLSTHLRGSVPLVQTVFSPLTIARKLSGSDFGEQLRGYPDWVEEGLAAIAESTASFARACMDAGADGIFFATQLASYRELSPEEYARFGRPYDLRVLKAVSGVDLLILHLHGEDLMFESLLDYPVNAINWHNRRTAPSLEEARSLTGKCLLGGLDERFTLLHGSTAEVEAEAVDAISRMQARGFILAPGCVLATSTPEENIRAAVNAARGTGSLGAGKEGLK